LAACTATTWLCGWIHTGKWTFLLLVACWIVFGAHVLFRLLQNHHRWLLAMPILFVIAIVVGVSLPIETFNQLSGPVNVHLTQVGSPIQIGKIGHILCFAALTFFLLLYRRRWKISYVELMIVLALLGLATEGIQLFIAGRTPTLRDFGFDLFGVSIGAGVYQIIKVRRQAKLGERNSQ
jgi:VanZ family protein